MVPAPTAPSSAPAKGTSALRFSSSRHTGAFPALPEQQKQLRVAASLQHLVWSELFSTQAVSAGMPQSQCSVEASPSSAPLPETGMHGAQSWAGVERRNGLGLASRSALNSRRTFTTSTDPCQQALWIAGPARNRLQRHQTFKSRRNTAAVLGSSDLPEEHIHFW